jgi:hypothetical protein
MKKIVFATLMLTAGMALSTNETFAQEAVATQSQETPVDVKELPEVVKTTLASEMYKDWTATKASLVNDGSREYYKITLTKDSESMEVKLDKEGKPVQ